MATGTVIGIVGAVAAAGAVAASAINASASRRATQSANESNLQIMREQQQYQTGERLAAQEYNTPANQRARFEAAGINPYMMLGQMNAGNTEAMTSPSSAQVEPAPDFSLGNSIGQLSQVPSDLLQLQSQVEQVNAQKEQVELARTENVFKARKEIMSLQNQQSEINERLSRINKNSAEYDKLVNESETIKQQIKRNEIDLRYMDDYYNSRNKRERNLAQLAYEQQIGEYYKNIYAKTQALYAQYFSEAELKRINAAAAAEWSTVSTNKQLANLYSQSAQTEFASRALKVHGLRLDNERQEIANQYIGEQIRSGLELQRCQISQANQDYTNPFKYMSGALGAILGFAAGKGVGGAASKSAVPAMNVQRVNPTLYVP